MSDIHKLLSLFDTAAQAHGWASDQGTRAQAQTALANYQRARGDLEQALDAHAAEIKRLRAALNEAVRVLESARLLCNWPSMNEAIDAAARAGRAALARRNALEGNHDN